MTDDSFIDLAQLEQDIEDAIDEAFDQWLQEILDEDEYED